METNFNNCVAFAFISSWLSSLEHSLDFTQICVSWIATPKTLNKSLCSLQPWYWSLFDLPLYFFYLIICCFIRAAGFGNLLWNLTIFYFYLELKIIDWRKKICFFFFLKKNPLCQAKILYGSDWTMTHILIFPNVKHLK